MFVCNTCKDKGVYYVPEDEDDIPINCSYCKKNFCCFHFNRHKCIADYI